MTRIIAGSYRGRRLAVPDRGTRPTSERVREAIFSRLASWGVLQDARVLDLYAGSGALGLEACSRGAASADLVEVSAAACRVLRTNVDALAAPARIHRDDAARFLARPGTWDIVFADPPYDLSMCSLEEVTSALGDHLSDDAVVVWERARRDGPPPRPSWAEEWEGKEYGETAVWYSQPRVLSD